MNDTAPFKRMKFFTGFFTTAQDWTDEQAYHLAKRRLHNRTLHTPGIVRGERQELNVIAKGGLDLEIQPGVALDGQGREIHLHEPYTLSIDPARTGRLYLAIRYDETETDWVEYDDSEYKDYSRIADGFSIAVRGSVPDDSPWVELARLEKASGANEIAPGDLDRSHVSWAGAIGTVLPQMEDALRARLISVMRDKREGFAALSRKLPVPSAADVRNAALTVEILARAHTLRTELAPQVLEAVAEVEEDVGEELGTDYPNLAPYSEFAEYRSQIAALKTALYAGEPLGTLLEAEDAVSAAARDLADLVVTPIARAGDDRSVTTDGEEATVALDAGASTGILGIAAYRWSERR